MQHLAGKTASRQLRAQNTNTIYSTTNFTTKCWNFFSLQTCCTTPTTTKFGYRHIFN